MSLLVFLPLTDIGHLLSDLWAGPIAVPYEAID
jgi:hypothetical protein